MAIGLVLSGCGGSHEKPWPVAGKVTFRGKPVSAGTIRFSNADKGIDMTADLHPDGAYEVTMARGVGLPAGTYQVVIMPPQLTVPLGPIEQPLKRREYRDIPAKYRLPSTSGLTLVVKPASNRFDLDMLP